MFFCAGSFSLHLGLSGVGSGDVSGVGSTVFGGSGGIGGGGGGVGASGCGSMSYCMFGSSMFELIIDLGWNRL